MTDGPASSSIVLHRALLFSPRLSLTRGPPCSASPSTRSSIRNAHAFLWLVDPPLSAFSSSLARDKIHGRAIHGNKSPYPPREIPGLFFLHANCRISYLGYLLGFWALPQPSCGRRWPPYWRPVWAPPRGGSAAWASRRELYFGLGWRSRRVSKAHWAHSRPHMAVLGAWSMGIARRRRRSAAAIDLCCVCCSWDVVVPPGSRRRGLRWVSHADCSRGLTNGGRLPLAVPIRLHTQRCLQRQ
jgi:hypothetical protein